MASRTLQAQAWGWRVPREQVIYLPNGLDPEDYPGWQEASGRALRARLGLGDSPVIVLYTRFFEFAAERPARLLAAVRRQVPDARLLVVGAGKYGQERRLQAEAGRLGLRAAVHLTGWLHPTELPAALRAADVALVLADDTLANRAKCSVKLAELLWLGLPVVAERVGEHTTYVEDGRGGLLADSGDDQGLVAALVGLLHDSPRAVAYGTTAQQRIEQQFGWSALAPSAEAAYQVALTASRR